VVATSKGAEGLELVSGRDILVADDPVDFAGAVLRLLDDPALRRELGKNGRKVVVEQYAWPEIGRQFVEFVESVAVSRTGGARR
jgi:glycosyltransferase involved in cell wall biosynthesis